ncbi:hypothetical protein DFP72DRAFT_885978 [Ephemerocybe angulata]|uniref:BTB domain-containing protein n=1 Tax=Ephemerocybe angulata TaxID=980116 RepID=A0A8H6MCN0_9AGAR|nr:hypothetical protein DFP72DRAFT_885978 [Tulosesus angulatus]
MAGSSGDTLTFHPDFCYEDGSIILLVNSPTETAFKVHKGLLSQYSSVFKDMTSLSLTNDSGLLVYGSESELPVVRLRQDDAVGLSSVLKAIYDNRFFDRLLPKVLTDQGEGAYLSMLSAMMPVARKYDFSSVLDGCADALCRVAPTYLPKLTERLGALRALPASSSAARSTNILTALHLADASSLYDLLPSLFYQISAFLSPEEIYDLPNTSLSWKDKTRCILGVTELRSEQDEELHVLHVQFPVGDCTKHALTDEGVWMRPHKWTQLSSKLRRTKRVMVFEKVEFEKDAPLGVVQCRDCTLRYEEEYVKNQWRVWGALPKVFRLAKSWEGLAQGRVE